MRQFKNKVMNGINFKKRGKVKISREIYFNNITISYMFRNFLPVKIEEDIDGFMIIAGYSKFFDELEEGCTPPFYDFVFSQDVQGMPELLKVQKLT